MSASKSTGNEDLMQLSSEEMQEKIVQLKEEMARNEEEGKYLEAEEARIQIENLTNAIDTKVFLETRKKNLEQKEEANKEKTQELAKFNEEMDQHLKSMNDKFAEMKSRLAEEHEKQLKELQEQFDSKYENVPCKLPPEILNLKKSMLACAKQKKYKQAHAIQQEIEEKTKKANLNYEDIKSKTLSKEIENLRRRQELEKQGLESKMNCAINDFNRNRALRENEILLNHKNILNSMDNKMKVEEAILDGIANKTNIGLKGTLKAKGEFSDRIRKTNCENTQRHLVNTRKFEDPLAYKEENPRMKF